MRTGITVKVTAAERDRLKAVLHFTEISVLIEQYDNKLGMEFRTEVNGHFDALRCPRRDTMLGCDIWLSNCNTV
jgi:hypothetical protein